MKLFWNIFTNTGRNIFINIYIYILSMKDDIWKNRMAAAKLIKLVFVSSGICNQQAKYVNRFSRIFGFKTQTKTIFY